MASRPATAPRPSELAVGVLWGVTCRLWRLSGIRDRHGARSRENLEIGAKWRALRCATAAPCGSKWCCQRLKRAAKTRAHGGWRLMCTTGTASGRGRLQKHARMAWPLPGREALEATSAAMFKVEGRYQAAQIWCAHCVGHPQYASRGRVEHARGVQWTSRASGRMCFIAGTLQNRPISQCYGRCE